MQRVVERFRFYIDRFRDFLDFINGAVKMFPNGSNDAEVNKALHKVFHAHLEMNLLNMKDGNIVVAVQPRCHESCSVRYN